MELREIERLLGAGGFGEVYRARHELMGREVAIKILHSRCSSEPEAITRFLSEARAIATAPRGQNANG